MSLDVFAALAQPLSEMTIHNVRLVDVQHSASGHEQLTVEYAGSTRELVGGGRWTAELSRRDVGRTGYVVPAPWFRKDVPLPESSCYFRAYLDPSLRRMPELDASVRTATAEGRAPEVVGWICDSRPSGFRAPIGLIPGEDGRFVPDDTVPVTIRVPPEFVRECRRVQKSPEELLRSFVGDLAGLQNYVSCPRADGYGSNGSDEREYADAWLQRAHGMDAIDVDELENVAREAEEKQDQRDDFAAFLDDFEHHGGNPDDLFKAVQAMVSKQAEGQ